MNGTTLDGVLAMAGALGGGLLAWAFVRLRRPSTPQSTPRPDTQRATVPTMATLVATTAPSPHPAQRVVGAPSIRRQELSTGTRGFGAGFGAGLTSRIKQGWTRRSNTAAPATPASGTTQLGAHARTQVRALGAEGVDQAAIARKAGLSQDVVMMLLNKPHRTGLRETLPAITPLPTAPQSPLASPTTGRATSILRSTGTAGAPAVGKRTGTKAATRTGAAVRKAGAKGGKKPTTEKRRSAPSQQDAALAPRAAGPSAPTAVPFAPPAITQPVVRPGVRPAAAGATFRPGAAGIAAPRSPAPDADR